MCIKIKSPKMPEPMKGPPPITPRVEKDFSTLPKEGELVDPDDKVGVDFGSSKKKGSGVTTRAKGTEALRIPLNNPGGGTGGTGINA